MGLCAALRGPSGRGAHPVSSISPLSCPRPCQAATPHPGRPVVLSPPRRCSRRPAALCLGAEMRRCCTLPAGFLFNPREELVRASATLPALRYSRLIPLSLTHAPAFVHRCTHTHRRIHRCTRAHRSPHRCTQAHRCTQEPTQVQRCTRTQVHTGAHTGAEMHTHTGAHRHTHRRIHRCTRAHRSPHRCTQAHRCTQEPTQVQRCTRTQVHTGTHTGVFTGAHSQMHTRTHTACPRSSLPSGVPSRPGAFSCVPTFAERALQAARGFACVQPAASVVIECGTAPGTRTPSITSGSGKGPPAPWRPRPPTAAHSRGRPGPGAAALQLCPGVEPALPTGPSSPRTPSPRPCPHLSCPPDGLARLPHPPLLGSGQFWPSITGSASGAPRPWGAQGFPPGSRLGKVGLGLHAQASL
uniref:uncharacterized protein LOC129502054 isoform X1 n=1 Tax=Nyctereutes procyonoides TaxID=34880 RepID=UPI002443C91A|nr:uncharacterized protein LOC129502054 isoform X1 [Nyctereutes procyonoides]